MLYLSRSEFEDRTINKKIAVEVSYCMNEDITTIGHCCEELSNQIGKLFWALRSLCYLAE